MKKDHSRTLSGGSFITGLFLHIGAGTRPGAYSDNQQKGRGYPSPENPFRLCPCQPIADLQG